MANEHRASARRRIDRKTEQLCKQVQRALIGWLGADCSDAILRDLEVESVRPFPNASRLLVLLRQVGTTGEPVPRSVVTEQVSAARIPLREAVAASIHRKRVPELVFDVLGPGDVLARGSPPPGS